MPLVEPQQFKRDDGVIITCAQPIDSERLAEIIKSFLQEVSEWKDDPSQSTGRRRHLSRKAH
jgi:hypothetical protein